MNLGRTQTFWSIAFIFYTLDKEGLFPYLLNQGNKTDKNHGKDSIKKKETGIFHMKRCKNPKQ